MLLGKSVSELNKPGDIFQWAVEFDKEYPTQGSYGVAVELIYDYNWLNLFRLISRVANEVKDKTCK